MLASQALYLLLTDEAGSPEVNGLHNLGSTAAVITDLVVAERLVVSDHEPPRVHLISHEPVGDLVLDTDRPGGSGVTGGLRRRERCPRDDRGQDDRGRRSHRQQLTSTPATAVATRPSAGVTCAQVPAG